MRVRGGRPILTTTASLPLPVAEPIRLNPELTHDGLTSGLGKNC